MRTNFCPHCASDKVHKIEESNGSHFHECADCQEAWEHHEAESDEDNTRTPRTHKYVATS